MGECTSVSAVLPFSPGEKLNYDVYFKRIHIGTAVLTFHGEKMLDDKIFYHISFDTDVGLFKDRETIYAERNTFLPYRVLRRINQIGTFPYSIREEYDQNAFRVRIRKKGKFLSKKITIQKKAPIHNPILLPYYYRTLPFIRPEERIRVSLPLADFDVILKEEEVISTPLGEHKAYVFTSVPERFKFWLSTDEERIPLKLEGVAGIGYSLVINSVERVPQ